MQNLKTPLWMVFIGVLALGCQTPCDPHRDGFFSGIAAMASGCYQNRIDEKEQALRDEISKQQQSEAEAARNKKELEQMQNQLKKADERLASLETSIDNHRRRLAQEQRLKSADEAELQGLEARLGILKKKVAEAKNENFSTQEAEDNIKRLTDQIDQVGAMIEEITWGTSPEVDDSRLE